ncbi:MAG: chorismate synthase [Lachnospiraceae bacterium]|nr:chorismate synthase [Lachnospiraceae bacterium]
MYGSSIGNCFRITTWGESHGPALGVVLDGVPAGLSLTEADFVPYMQRRKPGQSRFTTARAESDTVEILSGVFEGKTTGTPLSLLIRNQDHHSADYSNIADTFRPGHADLNFTAKYGFRDYRGGGRSSGRETSARVAAGAVAEKILREVGIAVSAYTLAIGPYRLNPSELHLEQTYDNALYMPNQDIALKASAFLEECMKTGDSAGGIIECRVDGLPAGIGDPVFEKLDANLGKALFSIGAVKGVEIGDGFSAACVNGSENNDPYIISDGHVTKSSNHSGGITGGMSDGSPLILRAAIKPTPSISMEQDTVTKDKAPHKLQIKGRHDPVIVPRAVVVVEAMTAITVLDAYLGNMSSRMDHLTAFQEHLKHTSF